MKNLILHTFALSLMLGMASPAAAACFADYKAKRDNPLRLHYGVIEISDAACSSPKRARAEVSARLAPDNWQLLNIVSVFDGTGLNERHESAGEYYLRY